LPSEAESDRRTNRNAPAAFHTIRQLASTGDGADALTYEVAYGTLLGDRRRTLHARLVEDIERLQAGRLDEQVDRLAQHAQRGEVRDKAVTYGQQAGARAMAHGDLSLAAASFEAALAAAAYLPPTRETQALSVDLNIGLRGARAMLGELERALDTGQRALMLAEAFGDGERLMNATAALMGTRNVVGDSAGAAALGERALVLADAQGYKVGQVRVCTYLAQAYIALGDLRRAIALLERNREVFRSDAAAPFWVGSTGGHAGVASDLFLAFALALDRGVPPGPSRRRGSGPPQRSLRYGRESPFRSGGLEHPSRPAWRAHDRDTLAREGSRSRARAELHRVARLRGNRGGRTNFLSLQSEASLLAG
jgi:tetratricopeptide (TPR) repeat protein